MLMFVHSGISGSLLRVATSLTCEGMFSVCSQ